MMTFLAAAKSSASENEPEAVRHAEAAARIARQSKDISDLETVKAFGEWAIALAGRDATLEGALRAYPAWNEAADRMFYVSKRDNEWKDIFVLFGHINSFLVNLATTGHPPDHTSDGEEYTAPRQGMFLTSHPERINYYRDDFVPTVMWLLSQYAWKAGDESSATAWMKQAGDEIEGLPLTYITATITRDLVPEFLHASNFDDAIFASLRGSQVLVACKNAHSEGKGVLDPATPFDDVIAEMSHESRRLAECFGVIAGVIPALLHILRVAFNDREKALDSARQVAAICRQMAAAAADAKFWTGSADVFDAIANEAHDKEFLRISHSFSESQYAELRVLGYLASTAAGNAESAFRAQLACLQRILTWYPVDSANYIQLLLPYIELFWITTFQRSRFQFRSPKSLESQLAEAMVSEPSQRVRAILVALLPAFRTAGLDNAVSLLRGP